MAGGQISPSHIDFHRRPYNTLALPCERVIGLARKNHQRSLTILVINACPVVIGGDFNVRFQPAADPDSRLTDVLSSFDMVQHVSGSTHRCGNTLDLVMTFADCQLNAVTVDPVGIVVCHLIAMNNQYTC